MPGAAPKGPPDVLAYDDYRRYLCDAFAWRKARERGFSHGVLARRAGLSSRSHLNLVLKGTVGLSPQAVEKYVEGFNLRGRQADYFRLLVRLNQAKDPTARESAREAIFPSTRSMSGSRAIPTRTGTTLRGLRFR